MFATPGPATPAPSSTAPAPAPAPPARNRAVGIAALAACTALAAVLGGGIGAGAVILADDPVTTHAPQSSGAAAPAGTSTVADAVAKASGSVVTLNVAGQDGAGSGSGIALDADGHILTNTHVVTLGGTTADPQITVRLSDGSTRAASVVGTDPLSDLAVVKVDDADGLVPAELGSSADLNVGDETIAIGAPLGLDGTVTSGIVSTLDRTISVASADAPSSETDPDAGSGDEEFEFFLPGREQAAQREPIYLNVIQTDAAINQGNSGGALLNADGALIGVNVAIASVGGGQGGAGSIGVGFAIPIDYASRIATDLIDHGEAAHGFLGLQLLTATDQQSAATGATVDSVAPGTPAEEAGLQSGDVITAVDDAPIGDGPALTAVVREYRPGDQVDVTFQRDGTEQHAELTIGELTD